MKRLTSLALLSLAACTGSTEPVTTCGGPALERTIVVLETDFQSSALGRIAGGCLTEQLPDLVLGSDLNLLAAGGHAYAGINGEGTLRAIDGATLALGPRLQAYAGALGEGGDTHGIYGVDVGAGGELWVSRDDAGSVAVLKADGSPIGSVDLSDLDPDGVPDMNGILVKDGRAYVALDLLAYTSEGGHLTVTPQEHGAVAVIDNATRQRVLRIELLGGNPAHGLLPTEDGFVVATPGSFDEAREGDGIDRVRLGATPEVQQVIDEKTLGGSVNELTWASDHEAYAIVLGAVPGVNPTRVVAIDPSQGTVTRELTPLADAFVHSGLVLTDEYVVVGDHTPGAPRVLFFPRAGGSPREIPASILPPFALVALPP